MASPLTTTSPREARRAAIDGEAARAVATPAFIASLNLPPIPASTPPLERRELEARRTELINQLAWAAAEGNEAKFRTALNQLKPGASDLTAATAYGTARLAFLEKREDLLMAECVGSLSGTDRTATEYWMRQLSHTIQERFNIDPQGMATSTSRFEGLLRFMASRIPAGPDHNRRTELLLDSAISAGFPVREVFAIANKSGIANQSSALDPQSTVIGHLILRTNERAAELFRECATLYGQQDTSSSAQIDFSRKYAEFRRLTAGLLPLDPELHFDQSIFARPADQSAFLQDLRFHFRISAGAVFVP